MDERIDELHKSFYEKFFSHLTENKIGYFDHMKRAFSISARMFICGTKTIVHGIFPYFWTTSATDTVHSLYKELYIE